MNPILEAVLGAIGALVPVLVCLPVVLIVWTALLWRWIYHALNQRPDSNDARIKYIDPRTKVL